MRNQKTKKETRHRYPKTHFNDAFCIAGGQNQKRVNPLFFQQKRKNNRIIEKFYDSKIIDTRTGDKVSGGELNCGRRTRNKNLNGENLRVYRGIKVSKGKRSIRKQRYPVRPNDIIKFDGKIFRAVGTHNKGKSIRLKNGDKAFSRSPKKIKVVFGILHNASKVVYTFCTSFLYFSCLSCLSCLSCVSWLKKYKKCKVANEGCLVFHQKTLQQKGGAVIPPLS